MYCKQCGKALSNEAFMCPDCGAPTDNAPPKKEAPILEETNGAINGNANHITAISTIAFVFSIFAFIVGFIDAFFIPVILCNILISLSILPSFASLSIGIYSLIYNRKQKSGIAKSFSIVAIVFASMTLVFFVIMFSIYGVEYWDSYY